MQNMKQRRALEERKARRLNFPAWISMILHKNGRIHQFLVACEELAELTKELTKAGRGKENDMRIMEEVADVEICLTQLRYLFDPLGDKERMFKEHKIKRLCTFYIDGEHK